MVDTVDIDEPNKQQPQHQEDEKTDDADNQTTQPWTPGPSRFVDPFRGYNGGFQIYGRRRSICVMSTIPETQLPSLSRTLKHIRRESFTFVIIYNLKIKKTQYKIILNNLLIICNFCNKKNSCCLCASSTGKKISIKMSKILKKQTKYLQPLMNRAIRM